MSIRSVSIGNVSQRSSRQQPPRGQSARTAPGGSRTKIERNASNAVSATLLPSLGGSSLARQQTGTSSKPPGLPLGGGRLGTTNGKENKNTAVISIDDLQRLREQCGIGGAKSELQIEKEMRDEDKRLLMEKSRSRTKHWPNTIENMRVKRIEDRYRALEDAEVGPIPLFNTFFL